MDDPRLKVAVEDENGRYFLWHTRTPVPDAEGDVEGIASHSFGIYDTVEKLVQVEYAIEFFNVLMPSDQKPSQGRLKDGWNTCAIYDLIGDMHRDSSTLMHAGFYNYPEEESENA